MRPAYLLMFILANCGRSSYPVEPSQEPGLGRISLGIYTGCSVTRSGELGCWTLPNGERSTVMSGTLFTSVGVASGYGCAIAMGGETLCWPLEDNPEPLTSPEIFNPPTGPMRQIAAGDFYGACGIDESRRLTCWGFREERPDLDALLTLSDLEDASYGYLDTCVIDAARQVRCTELIESYVAPPPTREFVRVVSGNYSHCAIDLDGEADCWGRFHNAGDVRPPTRMAGGPFVDIDVAKIFCGIRADATLHCQSLEEFPVQPEVPAGEFQAISVIGAYACALSTDDEVVCFGEHIAMP